MVTSSLFIAFLNRKNWFKIIHSICKVVIKKTGWEIHKQARCLLHLLRRIFLQIKNDICSMVKNKGRRKIKGNRLKKEINDG
jgi:hypothetical protein